MSANKLRTIRLVQLSLFSLTLWWMGPLYPGIGAHSGREAHQTSQHWSPVSAEYGPLWGAPNQSVLVRVATGMASAMWQQDQSVLVRRCDRCGFRHVVTGPVSTSPPLRRVWPSPWGNSTSHSSANNYHKKSVWCFYLALNSSQRFVHPGSQIGKTLWHSSDQIWSLKSKGLFTLNKMWTIFKINICINTIFYTISVQIYF